MNALEIVSVFVINAHDVAGICELMEENAFLKCGFFLI